jgi:hypothetical protein
VGACKEALIPGMRLFVSVRISRGGKQKQRFLGGVSSIVTDGFHRAAPSTLELYQNKFRTLHELIPLRMAMSDVTMYRHSRHFAECVVFEGRHM